MVTIYRNGKTKRVTLGAAKLLEAEGWSITDTPVDVDTSNGSDEDSYTEDSNEEAEENDLKDDELDLSEIPIESMTIEQLRIYAEQLGIQGAESAGSRTLKKLLKAQLNA